MNLEQEYKPSDKDIKIKKMYKNRLNLRKMATIVAYFIVATIFASCGKNVDVVKNDTSIEFSFQHVVGGRLGGNSNLTISADSIRYFGSYRELQSPEVITHSFDTTVKTSKEPAIQGEKS